MSSSLPAAPGRDGLLWWCALAVGGAIACSTPVPAASQIAAAPPAASAAAAAGGSGGEPPAAPMKASPYAAAKDENSSVDTGLPGNDRVWALLIPVGVASAIYSLLRQQESSGA
ncbi:MAG: hypothetical protein VKI83_02370 [Synechococcaceae cyanobacterium]|nr:hypothetical protein [Synechococcaceae cyanobacterium]